MKGVAPDASVAVMKVFGEANLALDSESLQGLEYAVLHDHVDILSESFGGNPVPNPGTDPVAAFNADAVAAGVTAVVSIGDAGTTNTIGTPATAPGLLGTGASTTYRLYAQTGSYGYRVGSGGWESNNVSAISSSGLTDFGPRTIDVVAPGEAGWADCSTDTATFGSCADIYHGPHPQPIVAFGGTSESCPLTAGTAALVVQAYRETHGGATPSPALVKQIVMSSAQDLHVPAANQGAGLVDALRAVQQARSVRDGRGAPAAVGQSLLYSPTSIGLTDRPGRTVPTTVKVTNTGAAARDVTPALRALGPARTLAEGDLTLNPATDGTFIYQTGATVHDVQTVTFTVPAGVDRLVTRVAWRGNANDLSGAQIRATLFDPAGRLASHSRPQGSGGGFGEDEIHDPSPGTWKLGASWRSRRSTSSR
ncbi:MAG: S8 family serine peptidase [Solirubrobacteraceae bacterium]